MKIGVIGPIWENIPPAGYGGTEGVVYNLVNGLVANGHDVTLFGPKTAKVKARLIPTVDEPLIPAGIDWSNVGYTLLHIVQAFDHAESFDILHMHLNKAQDYLALALAATIKTPIVFTLHFKLPTATDQKDRQQALLRYKDLPYISISNSQRRPLDLSYAATVYNGLNLDEYPFVEQGGEYLIWLGKIKATKGTKEAILAAKKAGKNLFLLGAADTHVPEMQQYYKEEVLPLVDNDKIVALGEVTQSEKARLLGGALAFLNPIQWEEPFGLVMAESQAVGTPVISYRRGSAPEVIIDGKTGFLVETLDEMVDKISQVSQLQRADCRKNVEGKFTIQQMVSGYEQAYQKVIAENKSMR
jgi:glycosyltransferase involved in cell wall biosynthesis